MIVGREEGWFQNALKEHVGKINPGGAVTVKSNRVKLEKHGKLKSGWSRKKRC